MMYVLLVFSMVEEAYSDAAAQILGRESKMTIQVGDQTGCVVVILVAIQL